MFGPPLADMAHIVYYDQRGNGRSQDGDPAHWTLDQWADDLRDLCDVLGIERPVVLGTSFGSLVALNYASRHPEHPAGVIAVSVAARLVHQRMVDAFGRVGGPEARAIAQRALEDPSEEADAEFARVCEPLYAHTPLPPELLARIVRRPSVAEHFGYGEGETFDLRPILADVIAPTLVIAGEDDPRMTPEDADEVVSALPAAITQYHLVERAGHGVIGDRPDIVVPLVRTFVAELST